MGRPGRRRHLRHPDRAGRRLVLQAATSADRPRSDRSELVAVEAVASSRASHGRRAGSSSSTSPATASSTWWLLDGPTPGLLRAHRRRRLGALPPLPSAASTSRWDDPNLRFVDLDGDGHADVLITEHDVFTWHPSLAEDGFGPARSVRQPLDEEHGPRLVFADGTQSIYLADMCGDGLTDLVRIRNGEVCYWPNLGYGRFGAKVTMDNAPWFDHPDQFDQRRVRLADIDGSGTTDIIYLHRDGVRLYFNQSGNR